MYEALTRGLINAILLSVYLFTKWWKDIIHLISFSACPDYCECYSFYHRNVAVECRRANLTSIPSGTLRDFVAVYVVSLVFVFLLPLIEIHVHSHVQNNLCAIAAARTMITSLFAGGRFLHAFLARDHTLILLAGNRGNQRRT